MHRLCYLRLLDSRCITLQKLHRSVLSRYTELAADNMKRKRPATPTEQPVVKQLRLQQCTQGAVTQQHVDRLVVAFITEGLLPFAMVELPAFTRLVTGLQPGRTVLCRATVKARLHTDFLAMKSRLRVQLQAAACVVTTTDCWSARNRAYIGVTVHWLDIATLERRSAALACRRMRGAHTHVMLATALDDIHMEYGVSSTVCKTTTDNGANFVKAFSIFSSPFVDDTSGDDDDDDDDESDGGSGRGGGGG